MYKLTEQELEILIKILGDRLLKNWSICDRCASTDYDKYEAVTDECIVIRKISRALNFEFPDYIAQRF